MADTTSALAITMAGLIRAYLRPFDSFTVDGGGVPTFTFTPPLTVAEQASYADLLTMAQALGITATLTLAEFQALKPKLAEIRSFRTRTIAAWNALTATAREADEIAYLNDLTDVLRALLRDS